MNPEKKNPAPEKSAEKESLFAQVTRMSQEKRAISDRRAETRRANERVEISRQIAARTPLPKAKPLEGVKDVEPGFSVAGVDGDAEMIDAADIDELEPELEDDDDEKVDRSA